MQSRHDLSGILYTSKRFLIGGSYRFRSSTFLDLVFPNKPENTLKNDKQSMISPLQRWFTDFQALPGVLVLIYSLDRSISRPWIHPDSPKSRSHSETHTPPFWSVTHLPVKWHLIIDFQAVLRSPFASPFMILDGIAPASLILRLPTSPFVSVKRLAAGAVLCRSYESFETLKNQWKKYL